MAPKTNDSPQKKDEQLNEEELKKVSGGGHKPPVPNPDPGKVTPDIDCWKPQK
jgi:bacteriocin-like protein